MDTLTKTINILIADDHWVVRAAIGHLLRRLGDVKVHEAESADEAISIAEKNEDLDLVLLDLQMPGSSSLNAISKLRSMRDQMKVIMISVSENRSDVLQCLECGAVGYIPKTAEPDVILSTIRRVLNGEVALPQRLLVKESQESPVINDDDQLTQIFRAFEALTPRQQEIFALLADGSQNKEIAEKLQLSVNTVRVHLQAISSRLPARDRSQLVLYASRWKDRCAAH
ncbi:MAG: response regulator transcription factor [Pseudomonadota bacterium]